MDNSQQFYQDTTKYADQDRVNSILNVYKQNVGRDPGNIARFDKYYNDSNYYSNSNKIANELAATKSGKAWLNPNAKQAAANLSRDALDSPVDIYNKALEKLGIADARTRVTNFRNEIDNTTNLLNNLESNIQGRTSESLVTEAQRQRLLAAEKNPLVGSLNTLNTGYGNANQDVNTILGQAGTQTDLAWEGEQSERQALIGRLEEAIRKSNSKEDKRRFQAKLKQEKKAFKESKRQFNLNYNLAKSK